MVVVDGCEPAIYGYQRALVELDGVSDDRRRPLPHHLVGVGAVDTVEPGPDREGPERVVREPGIVGSGEIDNRHLIKVVGLVDQTGPVRVGERGLVGDDALWAGPEVGVATTNLRVQSDELFRYALPLPD